MPSRQCEAELLGAHHGSASVLERSDNKEALAGNRPQALSLLAMLPFVSRILFATALLSTSALAQQQPDFTAAQTEAVKFLGELVKIDTSNPPGNETHAAEGIRQKTAA